MAKAVSTFISIGLLVAAQRAAVYWQRNHVRSQAEESQSPQMTADAAAFANPQFTLTNANTNSTSIYSQP